MAVGENVIMSMWRLNTAAISIEKLLDEILKVSNFFFFLYKMKLFFFLTFVLILGNPKRKSRQDSVQLCVEQMRQSNL